MPDHVHCLFLLSKQQSIAEVIKQEKGSSAHFINQQQILPVRFSWQNGYAAYSVSEKAVTKVFEYIKNQKQHHITKDFEAEYDVQKNMNKLLITMMLLATVVWNTNAQQIDCRSCEPGQLPSDYRTEYQVICEYDNSINYVEHDASGNPIDLPPVMCVFVIINYVQYHCPDGTTYWTFDDAVLVDNRNYWVNEYGTNDLDAACSFDPSQTLSYINAVVPTSSTYRVNYPIGCRSMLTLQWPEGNYIVQLGGGDITPTYTDTIPLKEAFTYHFLPCEGKACCTIFYKQKVVKAENGETVSIYIPTHSEGNNDCGDSPDPIPFVKNATRNVIDPVTGSASVIHPKIVEMRPCESMCNIYKNPSPYYFKTGTTGMEKNIPLEYSANPTLIDDIIVFTANQPIQKVAIFSMDGKKVNTSKSLENNILNTSELKNGIYFIQVSFSDTLVKTIKVVKQ
jgi:hypothetical protein